VTTPVRRRELSSLAVLAPHNVVLDDADEAVVENFERSLEALSRAGVSVRRERVETLDDIVEMNAKYGTLTAAEAYNEYRDIVDCEKAGAIDRRVVKRIMDGKRMSANDLLSIQRGRGRLIPKFHGQLGAALLVMPTTPIAAPEVAPLEASDETFHKVNLKALRNTMLGNILDLCAVALPNGRDANGMPTSFLVSAGHGDDERLLGYALEIERIVREAAR
jgi:aspartyl-tRNA(Asn)/glutamyl-tRNA(Gln) amidotransferase subunit A